MEKQQAERHKERDRLFRLCDADLSNQPAGIQYQRMRHEREIEASFYVKALNELKMNRESAVMWAKRQTDDKVKNMYNNGEVLHGTIRKGLSLAAQM